jgi:hypothetical protein
MTQLYRYGGVLAPDWSDVSPDPLPERSRLEWRIGDAGDPARLIEDYLADQGLPVRDLGPGRGGGLGAGRGRTDPAAGQAYGATLFVSAAGCAHLPRRRGGPGRLIRALSPPVRRCR